MLVFTFCYQLQVQYILIILFGNINRIELFILIAKNINVDKILYLNSIVVFVTNRKINSLVIQLK